jgi:hypothetical protein
MGGGRAAGESHANGLHDGQGCGGGVARRPYDQEASSTNHTDRYADVAEIRGRVSSPGQEGAIECMKGDNRDGESPPSSSAALVGREPNAEGIRGRQVPPGCGAGGSGPPNAQPSGRTVIRGRDDGAPGRGDTASSRNSGMAWYLADIADRVAKRKLAQEGQAGPSVAERMLALRRRIASRAREPGAMGATGVAVIRCSTSTLREARQRGVQRADGEETAWASISSRDPAVDTVAPCCSTAQTEAATVVAHHDGAGATTRQDAAGELQRRQRSGARSSWCARQELLDQLSTSSRPPESAA